MDQRLIEYNKRPIPEGWIQVDQRMPKPGEHIIAWTTGKAHQIKHISFITSFRCRIIVLEAQWIWPN